MKAKRIILPGSEPERPKLLTALCLLTFIGSTLGFLGYFLASLFFKTAVEIILKYSSVHSVSDISPYYFMAFMVCYAVSLTGAIRMWKLHRDGLFIYCIAQLFILFLPAIWINWHSVSSVNAIFTILFIIGYILVFRKLKQN